MLVPFAQPTWMMAFKVVLSIAWRQVTLLVAAVAAGYAVIEIVTGFGIFTQTQVERSYLPAGYLFLVYILSVLGGMKWALRGVQYKDVRLCLVSSLWMVDEPESKSEE